MKGRSVISIDAGLRTKLSGLTRRQSTAYAPPKIPRSGQHSKIRRNVNGYTGAEALRQLAHIRSARCNREEYAAKRNPQPQTQIRNSNSYSLAAQVQAAGGDPVLLPIAPDQPERLRELIAEGLESDLLLLAGGVSMGKYDLVEPVLAEFQAEFFSPEPESNRESR